MRFFKKTGNWSFSFLHSIRFRLTLWFVFILAIVLSVFSLFIYYSQSRDLQADSIARMQQKLTRLQAYFHSPDWQNSNLGISNIPGPDSQSPLQLGDALALVDTSGQVAQNWGQSLDNGAIEALVEAAGRQPGLEVYEQTIPIQSSGGRSINTDYLFIAVPVLRGDTLLGFLIIGSPTDLTSELDRLKLSLILGNLVMLLIAFGGGLWLADRAIRPVKTITRAARDISESDLSRRLNLRGRDELVELAGTFDGMLARLQAAFDRQRQFVADASHELRTPLTITNLELDHALSAQRSPAEYQRALQVINVENERMRRMVNDLMTLARMDSGQAILQLEDLDLSDVALEAVERMAALAERSEVILETGELPELAVKADRQYLIQMISNLIENAIKYSGSGRTVRVATSSSHADQEEWALLRVSDNGPGIPPEHLPHLFDRFYRVDNARTQSTDSGAPSGSGLGLSIAAWIAKAHGGEIRVDSTIGKGTTFEVALPLQK